MELLFQRIDDLLSRDIIPHKPPKRIFNTEINENGELGGVYGLPDYANLKIHKKVCLPEKFERCVKITFHIHGVMQLFGPPTTLNEIPKLVNKWTLQPLLRRTVREIISYSSMTTNKVDRPKENLYMKDICKVIGTEDILMISHDNNIGRSHKAYLKLSLIRNGVYIGNIFSIKEANVESFVVRGDGALVVLDSNHNLYLLK